MKKNPGSADAQLRAAEREFKQTGDKDSWQRWLLLAQRAGSPLFTPEGVLTATRCSIVRKFEHTIDGFRAKVIRAYLPNLQVLIPIGPEDSEYMSYNYWEGDIWVVFEEDGPTLFFEGKVYFESVNQEYYQSSYSSYQGFQYIQNAVTCDQDVIVACQDSRVYSLDLAGWQRE